MIKPSHLVVLLTVVLSAAPSLGQLDCLSPPWRQIPQDTSDCNDYPTDAGIAVSESRIVLTTNCQVRIIEKACGSLKEETYLWTDASDGLFVASDEDYKVFDPRVIYDPLGDPADPSPVFWIVASERGALQENLLDTARLRIAVSTTDEPDDWESGGGSPTWHVYNYDLRAEEPDGDPEPAGFADRPSITVDEDYLYVVFEEVDDGTGSDDRSMVVIFPKADLMSGTKGDIVKMRFIDDSGGAGLTTLHEFAVIDDLTDDDENRVYLVATEDHPRGTGLASNEQENIVLGCVFWDGDSWEYDRELLDIDSAGKSFKGATGTTFGDDGNQDTNPLSASAFFDASHREADDMVWAIHHVRQTPPVIETNRTWVQWYAIDLDGWPASGTPTATPTRLSPSGGDWLHDASLGIQDDGVVGFGFLSTDNDQYPQIESYTKNGANTAWDDHVDFVECWINGGDDSLDYSGTVHDPSNPLRFWGHSRVADSPCTEDTGVNAWETWVFRFDAPASRPDNDGDGLVSLDDLMSFQQLFAQESPRADLDGDGVLTALDWAMMVSVD